MKKILVSILILVFLLLTNINADQQEVKKEKVSNDLMTVSSLNSAPNWIIKKADNYIISLLGKNYFQDKFTLRKSSSYNATQKEDYTSSYHILYDYKLDSQRLYVDVRLDSNGNVVAYEGPKKPYSLDIDEDKAIEIAKNKGIKEPVEAKLVYGKEGFMSDLGTIKESIMWHIGSQEYKKDGLEVVYVDIDSGKILGIKTYPDVNIAELYGENEKDKEIRKENQSWFSKIILFFKSLFKSKERKMEPPLLKNNKNFCERVSDCEAIFLICGCQWGCFNKDSDAGLIQCMMDCEERPPKPECGCVNNKCEIK